MTGFRPRWGTQSRRDWVTEEVPGAREARRGESHPLRISSVVLFFGLFLASLLGRLVRKMVEFTGFVGMLALAGGLAFGLGGRDQASQWVDKIRKEMKH